MSTDGQADACAQEFKEAARLAAEVRTCAGQADGGDQTAAQAQANAEAADQEGRLREAAVAREQASIADAQKGVALVQWRRLQVTILYSIVKHGLKPPL